MLLTAYHALPRKYPQALGNPIRQYRRTRQHEQALWLTLAAPHIGAALKLYRDRYEQCRDFFLARLADGEDGDNLYYAFGIAAALNGDWANGLPMLEEARTRATHEKRIAHIDRLLARRVWATPTWPAAAGSSARRWRHGRFPDRIWCRDHRRGC